MEDVGSQDGQYTDEDDDDDEEMSDEGDPVLEPDDAMTLVQYQAEARREALIRKSSNTSEISPKKGRIESGGPSS